MAKEIIFFDNFKKASPARPGHCPLPKKCAAGQQKAPKARK
jgi:hypothetical protein